MPNQEPPIPAPFGTCQNCGQPVTLGLTHCPRCGARVSLSRDEPLNAVGIGCLGILALGFGSVGTCALLSITPSLLNPHTSSTLVALAVFLFIGAIASGVSILCVRRILEAIRARRDKP